MLALDNVKSANPGPDVHSYALSVFRSDLQAGSLHCLITGGNRQVDAGDYETAINAFQSALTLDPNSTDAEAGLKRANQAKQTEEDILRRRK